MDRMTDWPDGLFTRQQATRCGIGSKALAAGVRRGVIRRLAQGVYSSSIAPTIPEARHQELCRALLLLYPDAVLAGRSAAVARGLPTWALPLGTVLLHRPVHRQILRSGAVIRTVDPQDVTVETATGRSQSLPAALVQVALDHGIVQGVVCADAALARGLVDLTQLVAEVERRRGDPHSQRAAAMVRFVDALSESPGESRLRVMLASHGFALTSQVVITDGLEVVARADLAIDGTMVLLEFDGLVKYTDGGVDAVIREKRREDRLRALGYIVIRVTWADLQHPARVLALVRAAIARDIASRRPAL